MTLETCSVLLWHKQKPLKKSTTNIEIILTYVSSFGNCLYRSPKASKDEIKIIATRIRAVEVDNPVLDTSEVFVVCISEN